jgi:hypothetical protein
MKTKSICSLLVMAVALSFASPVVAAPPAKAFKNCTELRKVYPAGVAKSAKAAGATGAVVNSKVYKENAKSDRDNDGVACES